MVTLLSCEVLLCRSIVYRVFSAVVGCIYIGRCLGSIGITCRFSRNFTCSYCSGARVHVCFVVKTAVSLQYLRVSSARADIVVCQFPNDAIVTKTRQTFPTAFALRSEAAMCVHSVLLVFQSVLVL